MKVWLCLGLELKKETKEKALFPVLFKEKSVDKKNLGLTVTATLCLASLGY